MQLSSSSSSADASACASASTSVRLSLRRRRRRQHSRMLDRERAGAVPARLLLSGRRMLVGALFSKLSAQQPSRSRGVMAVATILLCSSFIAPAHAISASSLKVPWRRVDGLVAAETKDFSGEASGIFNNIRTPAALLAGASFGAAFALQPVSGEAMAMGLCKRVYLLISVSAVSAELIAVLVSSITLGRLGTEGKRSASSGSVVDYLREHYELEFLATQFNFQIGLLGLCAMVGIRAWVAFSCPRFGRIACGIVTSALFTMLALMQTPGDKCQTAGGECSGLFAMGVRYVQLLAEKCWRERSVLLLLSLGIGAFSLGELGMALKFMATRGRCAMHS